MLVTVFIIHVNNVNCNKKGSNVRIIYVENIVSIIWQLYMWWNIQLLSVFTRFSYPYPVCLWKYDTPLKQENWLCGICCELNTKILFNPLSTCICNPGNHIPHLLKCYINGTKIIYIFLSCHFFGGCYYRRGGGALLSGFDSKVNN